MFKTYIKEYKPFLLFLVKFFGCYLVLTYSYNFYLDSFDEKKLEVDSFTVLVANQSKNLLSVIDDKSYVINNLKEPCVNLYYKDIWIAKIVEGCNALSVMILFVSFIFAFSGKWIPTSIYITLGIVLIHCFNIVRIALIAMAIYHFNEYQELLHSVVFPLFIYGIVFLLWIVWVKKFSKK